MLHLLPFSKPISNKDNLHILQGLLVALSWNENNLWRKAVISGVSWITEHLWVWSLKDNGGLAPSTDTTEKTAPRAQSP